VTDAGLGSGLYRYPCSLSFKLEIFYPDGLKEPPSGRKIDKAAKTDSMPTLILSGKIK
jgi:hypothetical protein